ncbi:MAG: flotillin domain-containing protein [Myxococcales bacterium]
MNDNVLYLVLFGAGGFVTLLMGIGLVFARFYQRAGADEALVRTGSGGERVVIGGGTNVLPVLHQIMRVSLKSVPLMVAREGKNALVTADKIKANVTTELYVKVEPTKEDVLAAARSFGARNLDAQAVRDLVEGKLTDALRAVAANQKFQDLHANRKEFAEHVQKTLSEELKKNGLTLESVAITTFAQLPTAELDPNDVFDAEGRRAIAETVELNRKLTNTIKRDTDIAVQQKDVESRKQALAFEFEQNKAEADQQRQVLEYQAAQKAEQARRIAEIEATQQAEAQKAVYQQQLSAEQAALEKKRVVELACIQQEQAVAKADLDRQQQLALAAAEKVKAERTAQIEAQKAVEGAEIERAKAIETANIAKAKAVEATTIEKQKAIETATIAKQIAVTNVEAEKSLAQAQLAKAAAEQERAEQEILTVEKTSEAERQKQIALIEASRKAQEERLDVEVSAYRQITHAQAEADAKKKLADAALAEAQGLANARRTAAQAEADQVKIRALAEADSVRAEAQAQADQATIRAGAEATAALKQAEAMERLAEATLKRGKAEAEARQLAVAAENSTDAKLLMRDVAMALIEKSPQLVHELMTPVSAVSDVKVLQVNGLGGQGAGRSASPVGSVLKTLLDTSALAPVMKEMLEFGGIDTGLLAEKAKDLVRAVPSSAVAPEALAKAPAKPAEKAG